MAQRWHRWRSNVDLLEAGQAAADPVHRPAFHRWWDDVAYQGA